MLPGSDGAPALPGPAGAPLLPGSAGPGTAAPFRSGRASVGAGGGTRPWRVFGGFCGAPGRQRDEIGRLVGFLISPATGRPSFLVR